MGGVGCVVCVLEFFKFFIMVWVYLDFGRLVRSVWLFGGCVGCVFGGLFILVCFFVGDVVFSFYFFVFRFCYGGYK